MLMLIRVISAMWSDHGPFLRLLNSRFYLHLQMINAIIIIYAIFSHIFASHSEGLSKGTCRCCMMSFLIVRRNLNLTLEKLFRNPGRVLTDRFLRLNRLLQIVLVSGFLSLLFLYWFQFLTIIHHFANQVCLGDLLWISWLRFGHILGFWRFAVKKGHENAHLQHVEKVWFDRLSEHRFESVRVVEHF